MSYSTQFFRALLVGTLCCALGGCVATSATVMDEEVVTNFKPMYSYKGLVIQEFVLQRDLFTSATDAAMSDRDRRYAQLPARLAESIVREVKSKRIYQSVTRTNPENILFLVMKGKFNRVGRFRVSIEASLQDGSNGKEVAYFRQTLWDVMDTTEAINRLGSDIADFIDRIQYK